MSEISSQNSQTHSTETTAAAQASQSVNPLETARNEHAEANSADWYVDKGIPGIGPRPDFLAPKFKTLVEQARAFYEAEKKLSSMPAAPVAPEFYDLSGYNDVMDTDHPEIKGFLDYAKKRGMQQTDVSQAVQTFVKFAQSKAPNMEIERKKVETALGEGTKLELERLGNFIDGLSEEAAETAYKISNKAEHVLLLREIMNKMSNAQPTGTPSAPNYTPAQSPDEQGETVKEIEKEWFANLARYKTDSAYQNEITARLAKAIERRDAIKRI